MLECLELNSRQGTFVGPQKTRVAALAVVEAVGEDGEPCEVRFIGRVKEKYTSPYPMLRVQWVRAISSLPPAEFLRAVQDHYGFVIDIALDKLDMDTFSGGTEYDFSRRLVIPRGRDSARGDGAGRPAGRVVPSSLRRFSATESGRIPEKVGIDSTQVLVRSSPDDDEPE